MYHNKQTIKIMQENHFIVEVAFKNWIKNNSFIQANNIAVFLEPIVYKGYLAVLNFKKYNDALKFIEFYKDGTPFYNGILMEFDKQIVKGTTRGKVICRFKNN